MIPSIGKIPTATAPLFLHRLRGPTSSGQSQTQNGQSAQQSGLAQEDRVELSPSAKAHAAAPTNPLSTARPSRLDQPETQHLRQLKERDAEVRRHEAAHKSAAGAHAKGAPRFTFEKGPDGRQYASDGEVSIDTSEVRGDPEATIRKMQQVRRAALAPANPSAQDRAVAAKAARLEQKARAEKAKEEKNHFTFTEQSSDTFGAFAKMIKMPKGSVLDLRV